MLRGALGALVRRARAGFGHPASASRIVRSLPRAQPSPLRPRRTVGSEQAGTLGAELGLLVTNAKAEEARKSIFQAMDDLS